MAFTNGSRIRNDGARTWWLDGQRHREDGPAIEFPDMIGGSEYWYRHGLLHRTDGPAVTTMVGSKQWWLEGLEYDPIDWLLKVYEMEQNRS